MDSRSRKNIDNFKLYYHSQYNCCFPFPIIRTSITNKLEGGTFTTEDVASSSITTDQSSIISSTVATKLCPDKDRGRMRGGGVPDGNRLKEYKHLTSASSVRH